jgi:hypothetical protein
MCDSIWTLVRPYDSVLPAYLSKAKNTYLFTLYTRSHDAIQLEHETSLRLPQSRIPLSTRRRLGTPLGSYNLGRHTRLVHGTLESITLYPPRPKDQNRPEIRSPQEVEESSGRCKSKRRQAARRESTLS